MEQKNILLIEGNQKYAASFCSFFEKNGNAVLYVSNGEDAIKEFVHHNKDIHILVVNYNLKGITAFEILREVKEYCDIPVVFLLKEYSADNQMNAYRAGAEDCVPDNIPFNLLEMKLNIICRRVYGTNNILREGMLQLDLNRKALKVNDKYIGITIKEFELLEFFMRNPSTIYSRNQIINAVWGIDYSGSDRAVDSLVKKLRIKLQEASEYIHTVYGMGYYFEAGSAE